MLDRRRFGLRLISSRPRRESVDGCVERAIRRIALEGEAKRLVERHGGRHSYRDRGAEVAAFCLSCVGDVSGLPRRAELGAAAVAERRDEGALRQPGAQGFVYSQRSSVPRSILV